LSGTLSSAIFVNMWDVKKVLLVHQLIVLSLKGYTRYTYEKIDFNGIPKLFILFS